MFGEMLEHGLRQGVGDLGKGLASHARKEMARVGAQALGGLLSMPGGSGEDFEPDPATGAPRWFAKLLNQEFNIWPIVGMMGEGKMQSVASRVLTPTGWQLLGKIQVGDEVINSRGVVSHVTGVFPQGQKEMFRVEFSDGSSTECGDEHLWLVQTPAALWAGCAPRVRTLADLRSGLVGLSGNRKYSIPLTRPVQFRPRGVPLDAYLVGLLLGDGGLSQRTIRFTTADAELRDAVGRLLPPGVRLARITQHDSRLSPEGRGRRNPLLTALRQLGLHGHTARGKFVPDCYKYNAVEIRLALLQGLLDTDGSVSPRGQIEFTTVSDQLAKDVAELVQSLGGTASIRDKKTMHTYKGEARYGHAFRLRIVLKPEHKPFRLSRKVAIYHPHEKYLPHRTIVSATPMGLREAVCIMVDDPDGLYLTDDYIVTHNTTLAFSLAESRGKPIYMLDAPPQLKGRVKALNSIAEAGSLPPGSTLIIDDAQRYIPSRKSMSGANIDFQGLVFTARHHQFTVILTFQDSSSVDKTGMVATAYFLKAPVLGYEEVERASMRRLFQRALASFAQHSRDRWKEFVFVHQDESHEGLLHYAPPDWYTGAIAHYRGGAQAGTETHANGQPATEQDVELEPGLENGLGGRPLDDAPQKDVGGTPWL